MASKGGHPKKNEKKRGVQAKKSDEKVVLSFHKLMRNSPTIFSKYKHL